MSAATSSLRDAREKLAAGVLRPIDLAEEALARSSSNASQNTYLWQNPDWTHTEAARAEAMPRGTGGLFGDGRGPFWGIPVSVKDCFDLAGAPTSCGVHFYRDLHGVAQKDSWLVRRLRAQGSVIIGKTHLHPLAYGITGENPEFGDCVQPRDATALTGGSSSGAAASVQEGSAMMAIGTDTGGSVRAPAALCGLAGYRATHGWGDWSSGAHLAQSFDTIGCLFRELTDAPLLAELFAPSTTPDPIPSDRFAVIAPSILQDCDPSIVASLRGTVQQMQAMNLQGAEIDVSWWADSFEIFAPIQAWEAARIHAGHFDGFEPSIRQRLQWGASITDQELATLRTRHEAFRARMDDLLAEHQLLVMPAIPVLRLDAGADHSTTRARLLRYTTPFSLAGVPVVTIPGESGAVQVAAARGRDAALLDFAARFADLRKTS